MAGAGQVRARFRTAAVSLLSLPRYCWLASPSFQTLTEAFLPPPLFPIHIIFLSQPFYMPLTWPIGHVSSGIMRDPNEKASDPKAAPDLDIVGKCSISFLTRYRKQKVVSRFNDTCASI